MSTDSIINRKALRDYHILERYEAGIELKGSEVKSIRAGKANIGDAFARIEKGQAWLYNADIQPYAQATIDVPAPKRTRRLLLHKHEIDKLATKVSQKGFTLIPLALYFKGHRVKLELGLVTHKKLHDKREAKKRADDQREIDRAIKRAR